MHIVVITGASGTGKTAAVDALAARGLPGMRCFHFDSIGVPSVEDMEREFGDAERWQQWATATWIDRLQSLAGDEARVAVLDGQTRPSFVLAAAPSAIRRTVSVVLLDCADVPREARLIDGRKQPELATPRIANWAAYLRREADSLNVPIIDTSALSIADVADRIEMIINNLKSLEDRA